MDLFRASLKLLAVVGGELRGWRGKRQHVLSICRAGRKHERDPADRTQNVSPGVLLASKGNDLLRLVVRNRLCC